MNVSTPFMPQSPQAQTICDLLLQTSWVLGAILAVVTGLIVYIVLRFGRQGEDREEPPQVYGNLKFESIWTFIPFVIVATLTVMMARTMFESRPVAAEPDLKKADVIVIGHQWWWEIRYQPSGLVTANEVHLPVGKASLIRLEAADVIHDFWVPQLGPKEDMLPGTSNYIWITPSAAGVYEGTCAEYCGNDHAWMRIRVEAQTIEDFEAWQKKELQPPPAPTTPSAQQGEKLFQRYACNNCHRIAGTTFAGGVAPDLTWISDRKTLGSGAMRDNSWELLYAWLKNPQLKKPECYMPDFHLSDDDAKALADYLWRAPQ